MTPIKRFTLLELLLTVTIIAVLAAILLPTLSNIRNKVRESNCASNIKQLNVSVTLYSDDYDGYLPASRVSNSPWSMAIFDYAQKNNNFFRCPSDGWLRDNPYARSYACNSMPYGSGTSAYPFGTYSGDTHAYYSWKLSVVGKGSTYENSSPSKICFLGERPGDDAQLNGNFTNTNDTRVESIAYSSLDTDKSSMTSHKTRSNFSFGDGHVEPVLLINYKARTEKGNMWSWK